LGRGVFDDDGGLPRFLAPDLSGGGLSKQMDEVEKEPALNRDADRVAERNICRVESAVKILNLSNDHVGLL
jgi:hypothetical protein